MRREFFASLLWVREEALRAQWENEGLHDAATAILAPNEINGDAPGFHGHREGGTRLPTLGKSRNV